MYVTVHDTETIIVILLHNTENRILPVLKSFIMLKGSIF